MIVSQREGEVQQERYIFPLTQHCSVTLLFQGEVTQQTLRKLWAYLELTLEFYPEREEEKSTE